MGREAQKNKMENRLTNSLSQRKDERGQALQEIMGEDIQPLEERTKRTKANLKGLKKNLADTEGLYGLSGSSGSSGKKRKKGQADLESRRLNEREVQRKNKASGQPTLGWLQASSLSRPLQASPSPPPGLSRLADTDPHGSFVMVEAANTARGSTMLK